VPSVKAFLAGHHTAPHVIRAPGDLEHLFRVAARRGLLLTLHAEDQGVLDLLTAGPEPRSLVEHERTFSRSAALVCLGRVLDLVTRHGTRTHVLHVSSEEEVDLLVAAAAAGLPITFEATGHHLMFTAAEAAPLGAFLKLRPAIRTERDRARLWRAILDGSVTTIGSDHAPHTRAEKNVPFAAAPPGLPGVQELMPALLTGLRLAAPSLDTDRQMLLLARLGAAAPARLFGLDQRKGSLRAGLDADLAVVSPGEWRLARASIHSLCGWSGYEGRALRGAVRLTLRRGRVAYDRGRFGEPDGAWVGPRPSGI